MQAIRTRLRSFYGVPVSHPHHAPVDELILTVLSQNTNDRNRDVAYARLRERFSTWEDVRDAPVAEVEAAIAPGGISKIKSARIKKILEQIEADSAIAGEAGADDQPGSINLDWLADAPLDTAREYLCTLPGIGRKTAACVLLFSYGRPDIPVDTHVSRVGTRLGIFRPKAPFEEMHDTLLRAAPDDLAYETHVNMIRHGRRLCSARAPRCGICPLNDICPSRQPA